MPLRWRHVQAIIRLLQVVHVLVDLVSDWDSIVDCFEQLVHYFSHLRRDSLGKSLSQGALTFTGSNALATPLEIEKISAAVERFKGFSLFLSDSALVKLMTSLVALSMNNCKDLLISA